MVELQAVVVKRQPLPKTNATGQQATKCPKKASIRQQFCCKSTIWPGNGIFAEKNRPIINLFDPKTSPKKFDLQLRSAGNAVEVDCTKFEPKGCKSKKGQKYRRPF